MQETRKKIWKRDTEISERTDDRDIQRENQNFKEKNFKIIKFSSDILKKL